VFAGKGLKRAEADGDEILAVIRVSSLFLNCGHGG
jgi:acyl transferase domain-containing protein